MAKRRVVIREMLIDDLPANATGADMARAMAAKFEQVLCSVPAEQHAFLREKFAGVLSRCASMNGEQVRAATLADALDARADSLNDMCDLIAALGQRCSAFAVEPGRAQLSPHDFFMLGQAQADTSTTLVCLRAAADNLRKALKVPELSPDDDAEPEPRSSADAN